MKKILPLIICVIIIAIITANDFNQSKSSTQTQASIPTSSVLASTAVATAIPATAVPAQSEPVQTVKTVAEGTVADTLSWILDSEGTLTISGKGAIPNYEKGAGNQPWAGYKKSVKALVIENGITRIGHRAFQNFRYLESVVAGADVQSIGEWAFQNCDALTSVQLQSSAKIETGAFRTTPVEWEICGVASDTYAGSSFYQALNRVKLTGNYRDDIINIALSQVGYHEGNSEADYAGGNKDGSGDYTEYGKCLESVGSAWCSEFACWCIRNAGVPTSIIANSRSANVANYTAYASADFYTWDTTSYVNGKYTPQKGDLVLWSWDGEMHGTEENLSHTSILWEIRDLGNGNVIVKTIDGNSNNQVQIREYEINAASGSRVGKTGMLCYIIAPNY